MLLPRDARAAQQPRLTQAAARRRGCVVAMSGGVDSSVVAAMLADEGYDVVGVTLQLYDHGAALARKGACCAGRDIHDARRVAEAMGFPHYVLDYESRFRDERGRGVRRRLPRRRDAGALHPLQRAGEVPRPAGDRARPRGRLHGDRALRPARSTGRAGPELHRAADPARDQSYFLFSTTREQLGYLRFPLGGLASKAETRALAARYGLPVADKPDSQDICFVPNGSYAAVIEKLRPGRGRARRDRASRRPGARPARGRDPLHRRPAPRPRDRRRRAALRGAARRRGAAGGRRAARGAGQPRACRWRR